MQRFYSILPAMILALCSYHPAWANETETPTAAETTFELVSEKHVALLLPLDSATFAEAAKAVKAGFEAAGQHERTVPRAIRLYATSDDPLDVFVAYLQAVSAGAVLVIGPLTRDGVSAVASSQVSVPTLTLNTVDTTTALPAKLYLFGLQMENEAVHMATLAAATDRHHAIVIGDDSSLSRRMQTAFTKSWQSTDGNTSSVLRYSDDPTKLAQFRSLTMGATHLIFLALDAAKSRLLRAYLDPEVPVYATSQVFTGNDHFLQNNDLNGIIFSDMPWLLQPDHPAVMVYRQSGKTQSADMERLYALGIDAFRLMIRLLRSPDAGEIALDGVTGQIRSTFPALFVREPVTAQFVEGKAQLIQTRQPSITP